MKPIISAEWLKAMVDNCDYEPSGLITPNDRAELARRMAQSVPATVQETSRVTKDEPEDTRPYSLLLARK